MVAQNHYRWDFIGLSTDTKPTPADSEKVTDGSTYYTSDDSKLYVWYKDQWYEKEVEGGGGGTSYTAGDGIVIANNTISADLAQTTGDSTTKVMSQNATTKMVYPDIANNPYKMVIGEGSIGGTNKGLAINGVLSGGITDGSIAIGSPNGSVAQIGSNGRADVSLAIGNSASVGRGWYSVAIGTQAYTNSGQNTGYNVALGYNSYAGNGSETSTVALGAYAKTTRTGEVNIGAGTSGNGYNSTNYRVLGGVHDPVDAHDAATKGYVDANAGGGIKTLTADDYNYDNGNTGSYNTIGLWLLDDGVYILPTSSSNVSVTGGLSGSYVNNLNSSISNHAYSYLFKQGNYCWFFNNISSTSSRLNNFSPVYLCALNNSGMFINMLQNQSLTYERLYNNLTTDSSGSGALDAYQGKVLKDLIDALDARVTALEGA